MASHLRGAPRSAILVLADRARLAAQRGHLEPSHAELVLWGAEAEALHGLGRFAEARQRTEAALDLAREQGWCAADVLLVETRLRFHLDGAAGTHAFAQQLRARHGADPRASIRACVVYFDALDVMQNDSLPAAAPLMREAHELAVRTGVRPWLTHFSLALELICYVYSGDQTSAARALRDVDQLLERSPSPWFSNLRLHLTGVLLAQQGRVAEARHALEAAIAMFELCEENTERARTRRALAMAMRIGGDPDAAALLAETEAELEAMGIPVSPAQEGPAAEALANLRAPSVDERAVVGSLVVPVQRVTVRGLAPELLLRELVTVTEALAGCSVRLRDTTQPAALSYVAGTELQRERFEFGDGCGRRFTLSTGALSAEARAGVTVLVRAAALALEVNELRGLSDVQQSSDVSVPEVPGVIARSAAMRALLRDLSRLAASNANVLIQGDSGSGKEVIARAVHDLSTRSAGPYVTFNITAVPTELFEGQLFGHRKGAFTGASRDQLGVIATAHGGTLFLDEIGDLPLQVQPKLLRFLETREVHPLGAERPRPVDVRIVAATHRDLAATVADGRFREDLYYRLQVVLLRVPPLSQRPDDVLPLTRLFVARFAGGETPPRIAPETAAALVAHPWPGNVRELRNRVERALAFRPLPAVLRPKHFDLSAD